MAADELVMLVAFTSDMDGGVMSGGSVVKLNIPDVLQFPDESHDVTL
jgi:hypothetical protein